MGCTYSHISGGSGVGAQRVFKVYNVDETGHEHNAGKIEISETELVLRQRDKPNYRWPLRSLRRYGFDAELFSFESGRRCPTGPGIYAFRCQRAEALFNLLQECIQRAGQEPDTTTEPPIGGTLAATVTDDEPVNTNSLHLYVNSSLSMMAETDAQHEYINTAIVAEVITPSTVNTSPANPDDGADHRIQYAELDLPKCDVGAICDDMDSGGVCNTYMNVPALGQVSAVPVTTSSTVADSSTGHSYANLGLLSAAGTNTTNTVAAKVVYIELELQNGSAIGSAEQAVSSDLQSTSHNGHLVSSVKTAAANAGSNNGGLTAPTATKQAEGYAMIDFHRTAALKTASKTTSHEEGERKTRHNSNIDEL